MGTTKILTKRDNVFIKMQSGKRRDIKLRFFNLRTCFLKTTKFVLSIKAKGFNVSGRYHSRYCATSEQSVKIRMSQKHANTTKICQKI